MWLLKFLIQLGATGFLSSVFKIVVCAYALQARGYEAVGGEYLAVIMFFFIAYAGIGKIIEEIIDKDELIERR